MKELDRKHVLDEICSLKKEAGSMDQEKVQELFGKMTNLLEDYEKKTKEHRHHKHKHVPRKRIEAADLLKHEHFFDLHGMTPQAFMNLEFILRKDIEHKKNVSNALTPILQLSAALMYMQGVSVHDIEAILGMSDTSVYQSKERVSEAINKNSFFNFRYPKNENDMLLECIRMEKFCADEEAGKNTIACLYTFDIPSKLMEMENEIAHKHFFNHQSGTYEMSVTMCLDSNYEILGWFVNSPEANHEMSEKDFDYMPTNLMNNILNTPAPFHVLCEANSKFLKDQRVIDLFETEGSPSLRLHNQYTSDIRARTNMAAEFILNEFPALRGMYHGNFKNMIHSVEASLKIHNFLLRCGYRSYSRSAPKMSTFVTAPVESSMATENTNPNKRAVMDDQSIMAEKKIKVAAV
eukprot:Nk52_evm18s24 gene=Nk52_evmTU18s24